MLPVCDLMLKSFCSRTPVGLISDRNQFLAFMKRIPLILLATALLGSSTPIEDIPWHYTFKKLGVEWSQASFDDSNWSEGYAGFGNRTTPGSRVSTDWKSSEIWLRQELVLEAVPSDPALYIFHDEDAIVYINGRVAATFKGFVTEYQRVTLNKEAASLLHQGRNLIAVHCKQLTGGQASPSCRAFSSSCIRGRRFGTAGLWISSESRDVGRS